MMVFNHMFHDEILKREGTATFQAKENILWIVS